MSALHRIRRAIASLIVAFGVAACTDASEPPRLTQMTLSVPSTTVVTGHTVAVTPMPINQFGVNMPPAAIEWRSTATSIATVLAGGMLTSRTVTIPSLTLTQGQAVVATTDGLDQLGLALAVGAATWASASAAIATVDSVGTVRAVAPGTTTITVSIGTVTATRTITVTAPPAIGRSCSIQRPLPWTSLAGASRTTTTRGRSHFPRGR